MTFEWTITEDEKTPAEGETWHEAPMSGVAAHDALAHVGCLRRWMDCMLKPMGSYWLLYYGNPDRVILIREKECKPVATTCRICHASPAVKHYLDRWPWCGYEYVCNIWCPQHPDNCATGSSLDSAIDAQREAEAAWNNLQNQGEKA